jgi:predicted unusual protein kinase regulating ubiquinone biosynthesis (AarF/ABC1/UbiB family)
VHESLVDLLKRETDYLHEAECMRRMAKNFEGEPGVGFPEPIDELTTRDVLTMTFMEGLKITRLGRAREGLGRQRGRWPCASCSPSTRCSSSTASSTPIPTRGTS